ncbi:MAG: hypothetical protein HKN38_00085, partial [Altererythrobacter sp.]|nr:hypothetical protein [Altererythrobacter sp.]
ADSTALGENARADFDQSLAIGQSADVGGIAAIAIGTDSGAEADNALAIGSCADIDNSGGITESTECANATGVQSTAIGAASNASGDNAIAMGTNTKAVGQKSVAVGFNATTDGGNSIALGSNADANGAGTTAIGLNASASGINSVAMGKDSTASGVSAYALGPDANAAGLRSMALGNAASATATSSTAVGRDTSATHSGSSAFGFGATTSLANQMVFGTSSTTYVMPGITSALSAARQSGTIYYVTSDSAGNLAISSTPVSDSSGDSSGGSSDPVPVGDAPVATNTGTPTSGPIAGSGGVESGGSVESTSEGVESVRPGERRNGETGLTGPVDNGSSEITEGVIGSNLVGSSGPETTPIPGNNNNNGLILSQESVSQLAANTAAIDVNRQDIARNATRIDQAFSGINANTQAIEANSFAISDLEEGLAAVAALPDMYLNPDESWSAAGGAAVFGDEIGFGATLAIRGNDNWSFGASAGMAGDEATGKIQFRYGGN